MAKSSNKDFKKGSGRGSGAVADSAGKRKSRRVKSIVFLTVLSLLIVLAAVFAFVSFDLNATDEYHGYVSTISLGLDLSGGVYAVYNVDTSSEEYTSMTSEEQTAAIQGTADTMQSLLFNRGYTEAQVTVYGTTIRVEVPDVDDPERIFDLVGRPASLWLQGSSSQVTSSSAYDEKADGMDGSHIANAGLSYDSSSGEYVVVLEFDEEGTKLFSDLTSTYSGKYIAIFVNRELLISPKVNEAITSGQCTISGGWSGSTGYQDAYELAVQIMAGSFAVPLDMAESGVISATLGSSAITAGIISGAVGLALIVVYMIVLYKMMGVASALSLVYYAFTYLFLLAVFPWVQLTLSGIAGVLLSIGMAVDANVIIFERIKEESAAGKALGTACSLGFKRSAGAIIDGNITTIFGAVILIIVGSFGASALQGFGITLLIGIVLSLICSMLLTRIILYCIRTLAEGDEDKLKKQGKGEDYAERLFGVRRGKAVLTDEEMLANDIAAEEAK
mgnify:FL=1